MNKKIVLLGAGGHGLVMADIAKLNGYEDIVFLDDDTDKKYKYQIVGNMNDIHKFDECDFFVSIGANETRANLFDKLKNNNKHIVNLIHPHAVIAEDVELEIGIAIMAGVVINSGSHIGSASIINSGSIIEHENNIGDFVHISPGCQFAGNVTVGKYSWIGIGSTVINNIFICERCIIGACSLVNKNIIKSAKYAGVPFRLLEE